VGTVGDEALACARKASGLSIAVAVAPKRQQAVDLARGADIVILDGPAQISPLRASLSLLAVDASSPWGAGRCPPAGDMRFPIAALLDAVDLVVAIGERVEPTGPLSCVPPHRLRWARIQSNGAWFGGRCVGWAELRSARVGMVLATARPHRIVRSLASHGVTPRVTLPTGDHRGLAAPDHWRLRRLARDVDLWLCTEKCATHLPSELAGRPVGVLDHALELGPHLTEDVLACSPSP